MKISFETKPMRGRVSGWYASDYETIYAYNTKLEATKQARVMSKTAWKYINIYVGWFWGDKPLRVELSKTARIVDNRKVV